VKGEFEKRLNRLYTNYMADPPYQYYKGIFTPEDVEQMVDEARKEFPTEESIQGTYEPSEYELISGSSDDVLLDAINKWFEKWFGNVENK